MAEAHRDEIAKLEALYASNPEGRVFTHLAEAYRKSGDLDRARQTLNDGMKKHPDSASAYVVLGRVLSDSGDVTAGLDAFRRALELDAGNLVALRWCGDLAMRAGLLEDALGYYHELIARDPSDDILRERVAIIESDRAAAMSAAPEPRAIEEEALPSAAAASALAYGETELPDAQSSRSFEEFDPSDLPGDLAAFAGRQVESRTGKSWTPRENAAPEASSDDAQFADSLTIEIDNAVPADDMELLDLPMETSFGMDLGFAGDVPASGSSDTAAGNAADGFGEADAFAGFELAGDDVDVFAAGPDDFSAPSFETPAVRAESFETAEPTPFDEPLFEQPGAIDEPPMELEGPAEIESLLPEEDRLETLVPEAAEAEREAEASQHADGFEEGGFGDAVGGPATAPLMTETMAELYRNQGFPDRAADVYRQLLHERGTDARLEQKLAELEAEMATPAAETDPAVGGDMVLEQDDAGEMWLKDESSPWTSPEPGGAEHASPHGWESEPDEVTSGAPIASYFQSLLRWQPGNGSSPSATFASPASPASSEGATEGGYDDVLMLDEPAEASASPAATAEWTPDGVSAPAADEPRAAGTAEAPTSHTDSFGGAATAPEEELMPWEMGTAVAPSAPATPSAPAAPEVNAMPTPAAAAPGPAAAGELMPWETAPAAELAAPEASVAEASVAAPMMASSEDAGGSGAEGEDDEDLEDVQVLAAEPEEVKIAVIHGPNLNMLGQREPSIYGTATLGEIDSMLREEGSVLGVDVDCFQSNVEGTLIDHIQGAATRVDGFVVNAGGYTHTSVALLDALVGSGRPFVEVHLSNVAAREEFRHGSLLSAKAAGVVTGFGAASYSLGLRGLVSRLRAKERAVGGAV